MRVYAIAIASRILVSACMLAGTYFTRSDYRFWNGISENGHRWAYVQDRILDSLGRWDSWPYLRVAAAGYLPENGFYALEGAFFPLYPSLIRGLAIITHLPLFYCSVIISWACFLLSIRALFWLLSEIVSQNANRQTMIAFLIFPGSIFLTAAYTESLFLLLSIEAIYCARQRSFGIASIFTALATLTRPNGVFLLLPLLWEMRQIAPIDRKKIHILSFALPIIALVLHMWEMNRVYGNPIYFQYVQQHWGRHFSGPWEALFEFRFDPDYYLITLASMAALAFLWRSRFPVSLNLHATVSLLLPLCTGTMKSMPRFVGINFPLFYIAAMAMENRRFRVAYWTFAIGLLMIYAFRFGRADAIN